MSIQFQSSVIFVKDVEASRHLYEGLLGQKVLMDHGPNVAFAGGFAIWQVDHACQIIYGRAASEADQLGCDNCELYFEAEELGAIYARLSDAGAEWSTRSSVTP